MRVGEGTQSGAIAVQILTSSSAGNGLPSAVADTSATPVAQDLVKFSEQAKKIADRIAQTANEVSAGKGDRVEVVAASELEKTYQPHANSTSTSSNVKSVHDSSYADDLRSGQDGHAKIIESMEETLLSHKQNLEFARETVKLYDETGEFWSVQKTGKVKFDASNYGGEKSYIESLRKEIEGYEKQVIPATEKILDGMRTDRLAKLREYGLVPPAMDKSV